MYMVCGERETLREGLWDDFWCASVRLCDVNKKKETKTGCAEEYNTHRQCVFFLVRLLLVFVFRMICNQIT